MDLTKEQCKCAPSSSHLLLQDFLRNSREITNDLLIPHKRVASPGGPAWVPVQCSSLYLVSLFRLFSRVVPIWQHDQNDEPGPEREGVS